MESATLTTRPPREQQELEALYESFSTRLEQLVSWDVRAPRPVIEDACQFAWARLLDRYQHIAREKALPWLARTATREAWRLTRRQSRELPLDQVHADLRLAPCPEELVAQRDRIGSIEALPARQRRILWLRVLGLSYEEIARREACTVRTVERQLLRAQRAVRLAANAE